MKNMEIRQQQTRLVCYLPSLTMHGQCILLGSHVDGANAEVKKEQKRIQDAGPREV
jgi:hypothetical protein